MKERNNWGDRKTKVIGEAQIILKALSLHLNFTYSRKQPNLKFMYWEIMSWRTFRCEANGIKKMALRCFKDGYVQEFEIQTFQEEYLELLEAKLTLYTTKLAAGMSALKDKSASAAQRKDKPPSNKNVKVNSSKSRIKPPPGTKPDSKGLSPKKPLTSQQQMLLHASKGSGVKKLQRSQKGKKAGGGVVVGRGARRRPSMGTVL